LDTDAVRRAFAETISARIGVDVETAALGVQRIVDETMAAATRMHMAEKGKDPRKYTLIAFGGAGPVHAHNLARLLKVGKVVVPLGAGVASALGFLVAPPATDMVTSYVTRLERADWRHITALFADMRDRGCRLLSEAGADPAQIDYRPSAEMRHVGQGFEIPVPLPGLNLSADDLPAIRAAFFDLYRLRFGRTMEEAPIEVLSWRLACVAPGLDIRLGGAGPADGPDPEAARRGSRNVLFETHGWQECAVYDRYKLPVGARFAGPALIEERESACVVGPDATVSVDAIRNLVVELH
jgi:N-methylhydantoinase A